MAKSYFDKELNAAIESLKSNLNVAGGCNDRTDEIHAVVTYLYEGISSEYMLWGKYTRVRYEDDFFTRLSMDAGDIVDIRLFSTEGEAMRYLDEIEREFMEEAKYGKTFYIGTGKETRQPLRVPDGVEDVLLDLRLFSRYCSEGKKLSVDDVTAAVPVPLLRIDNGHVTFREDECRESVKKILDDMVYCYADEEEQEDLYNDY